MPTFLDLLAFDLALSVAAFALYAWDKAAAKARRRRVSERALHLVALLGGWPGALVAQRLLRHKTVKPTFQRTFGWTVVLSLAATTLLALNAKRS